MKIDIDAVINNHIFVNASSLVYELADKAEQFPDYIDALYSAYQGMPDCEQACRDAGYKRLPAAYSTWQELADELQLDLTNYMPDVFEHWLVSTWLAGRLLEIGERVIYFAGLNIWCRTVTGLALEDDESLRLVVTRFM